MEGGKREEGEDGEMNGWMDGWKDGAKRIGRDGGRERKSARCFHPDF